MLSASSLFGGGVGALLLRSTPPTVFEHLVPFLILFATILFVVQGQVQKWLRGRGVEGSPHDVWMPGALALNFAVAIYGGYFGAGMSIMMLSALGVLGMTDILQMNALTSLFALCVNGVAATLFIATHMVAWHYVLPMAVAAVVGGYGAAGLARKIGRVWVRRFVIAVGFGMSGILFLKYF